MKDRMKKYNATSIYFKEVINNKIVKIGTSPHF